jgi:glycosyltransferase involved in cell wall biosynthesis
MVASHAAADKARPIKVGVIRGAYLSQFEMQTYEHLLDRVDLEAYRIRINRFPTELIRVPLKLLACIDDPFAMISPKLGFYFDLFLQATNGLDYYHFGLEKALAGRDIAHTMETFNAFSWQALRAKQRYGTRLVVTVWENRPYAAERFTAKRRMKYEVLHGADLLLAMTPRAASCLELEGADARKIRVLPPGVDTNRFKPRPRPMEWQRRLGIHPDDFVFLSVAALRWEKGVQDILHAFKRLVLHSPGRRVKLVFAGSGPEEKRLRELADRIGLGDTVIFSRFPYEEMHSAYNLADVFMLASTARPGWLEQFGYVLAEALASGVPIITTMHGSIPEVVGEAALLVPPSDFLGLGDAMKKLLEDSNERERLTLAARARAETEFDSRKQADKLCEAYESLMK